MKISKWAGLIAVVAVCVLGVVLFGALRPDVVENEQVVRVQPVNTLVSSPMAEPTATRTKRPVRTRIATPTPTRPLISSVKYDGSPQTIRWLVGLGPGAGGQDHGGTQARIVEQINRDNRNVNVVLELVDNDMAADTLSTYIASGNAPDIVGPVSIAGANRFADAWLDLQRLTDEMGYDLNQFLPELVEHGRVDGELITVPFAVFPAMIFYNRELFDEAGIPYPPQQFGEPYADGEPWDFDKVREVGMLLTMDENGNDATSDRFDPDAVVQWGFIHQWAAGIRAVGHDWGAANIFDERGNATIPDSYREAIEWTYNGMWEDYFYPNEKQRTEQRLLATPNFFARGDVAMGLTHQWFTCCLGDAEFEWDLAIVPSVDGVYTSKQHTDSFRLIDYGQDDEQKQAAFSVLSYLMGEASGDLLQLYGGMPARPSETDGFFEGLDETYPHNVNWQVSLDSLQYPDIPSHEGNMPYFNKTSEITANFWSLLQSKDGLDLDVEIEKLEADLSSARPPTITPRPTLTPTPTPRPTPILPDCTNLIDEMSQSECEALVAIYNTKDEIDWQYPNNPCRWDGVTCNDADQVVRFLFWAGATELPAEIGNLTHLTSLDLANNQLEALPPEIGNLVNLTSLDVRGSQLRTVPTEIGDLTQLEVLYLGHNQLSKLPAEIWTLSNLSGLNLGNNRLSEIPSDISNLPYLGWLDLSDNQLTTVPSEVWELAYLRHLELNDNKLMRVPSEIGNLSELLQLNLSGNQLATFPTEISNLSNLTELQIRDNSGLSGGLPLALSGLPLEYFVFDITQLCEPSDEPFQAWLGGIDRLQRTGVSCKGEPTVPTLTPRPTSDSSSTPVPISPPQIVTQESMITVQQKTTDRQSLYDFLTCEGDNLDGCQHPTTVENGCQYLRWGEWQPYMPVGHFMLVCELPYEMRGVGYERLCAPAACRHLFVYVDVTQGEIVMIDDDQMLRDVFVERVGIDSAESALAYLLVEYMGKGYEYETDPDKILGSNLDEYIFHIDRIETSYAAIEYGNYHILLHQYAGSCTPYTGYQTVFIVPSTGRIQAYSRRPIFTHHSGICP